MPDLRHPGWSDRIVLVNEPAADPSEKAMLVYPDGKVAFEHICVKEAITVLCAPFLRLIEDPGSFAAPEGNHFIQQWDPITVAPSVLCPDCGMHGFVSSATWLVT